jgi:hypothetical protein
MLLDLPQILQAVILEISRSGRDRCSLALCLQERSIAVEARSADRILLLMEAIGARAIEPLILSA